jgi:hypothetical protein
MATYSYTVDGVSVVTTFLPASVQARAAEILALTTAAKPASTIVNGGLLVIDDGWVTLSAASRTPAVVT